MKFLRNVVISILFLSSHFSKILNLYIYLNVRDQCPHSYKTREKVTFFMFGSTERDYKGLWVERWQEIYINPLNAELNLICYFLALLGAHHFLHVSRIRVKRCLKFANPFIIIQFK